MAAIRTLAVTAVAVLASATMVGTPAEASSGPAYGSTTASVAGRAVSAAVVCEVTPAAGQGTINVRSEPNTSSSIVDYLQAGEFMESACFARSGGSYTACGGAASWIAVHIGLTWWGYVARKCVTLYEWAN